MQLTDKNKNKFSNEELIQGIKNKKVDVLQFVYKQYFPMVMEYIVKNSGSPDDAKDIFHDALTAIYEKTNRENLTLSSSFSTYLFAIAKNLWLMVLRKQKTDLKYKSQLDPLTVSSEEIDDDVQNHLRYKLYRKHFSSLGEDCQKVLKWFLDGFSLKEIADKMDFTPAYAKKKKFNCQKQLISMIEKDELFKELTLS